MNLSLIFCDIDGFKSFNDRFGHQVGDEALILVSSILRDSVRETDLLARYGGEELVVLLPDTDYEGALVLAEKLRANLAAHEWDYPTVTGSFGVTTLDAEPLNRQVLIEEADVALYHSKSHGKNCVSHYWDLPDAKQTHPRARTDCA